MELFDTHCHLDYPPLGGRTDAVLERARHAGVIGCVTIGTSVASSRANIELARRYPMLRAGIGVHPHEADSVTPDTLAEIEELAAEPSVVAIGEIGLDYYYTNSTPANQERAFRALFGIARRRAKPILIHCRDAYEPLLAILRDESAGRPVAGLIHCASGPPSFIDGALALGMHISFSGTVTFAKADGVRELARLVPDDRLLIETDAPYLAPQPVRGQPNEPAYVAHTAQKLAELRGVSVEELGAATTRNARRLFGLDESAVRG